MTDSAKTISQLLTLFADGTSYVPQNERDAILTWSNRTCVSAAEYGWVGDGSTDDTAAVQAALAAVPNGYVIIPYTPTGTKLLGAAGSAGVITLSASQGILGVGRTMILTGAGPAFSLNGSGDVNLALRPQFRDLYFTSGSSSGYLTGSTAMEVAQAGVVIESCCFGFYDKPITYENNCYSMTHRDCVFALNNWGVYYPSALSNSGAGMVWENCIIGSNVNNINIQAGSPSDFTFRGGSISTPQQMHVADLVGFATDNPTHVLFDRVRFETNTATSGTGARIQNSSARADFIECIFYEDDALTGPYFNDPTSGAYWKLRDCAFDIDNYTPYLLGAMDSPWTVTGCYTRNYSMPAMIHQNLSGLTNSDFATISGMFGWKQIAPTVQIVSGDSPFGGGALNHLSVQGVGAGAAWSDTIVIPAGCQQVLVSFWAKNLDSSHAASVTPYVTANSGGTSFSGIGTVSIPANTSSWTHFCMSFLPVSNIALNGCQLNILCSAAAMSGGECRYANFYIEFK